MIKYPVLNINLDSLEKNLETILALTNKYGIKITNVTKGCNGDVEVTKVLLKGHTDSIGSSRVRHLQEMKDRDDRVKTMLVRIPMISEIPEMLACVDVSLNSEFVVLEHINTWCKKMQMTHKVILMVDLGDLREGMWYEDDLLNTVKDIRDQLGHIELVGIGTNLGCYGSITPTRDKMDQLVHLAEKIESLVGYELEYISGGATSTLLLLNDDDIPDRINHLRIGEGIIMGQDLPKFYDFEIENYYNDVFILDAEIIEIKEKPSHPVGKIGVDAFGNKQVYEDKGLMIRALLSVGNQDIANHDKIQPLADHVRIIGSSSDHLIVELEDRNHSYQIGDIMSFEVFYQAMLQCFLSDHVGKNYLY